MMDHRQQGERQHYQADLPMQAVPGAGLVMIEPEFDLGGLVGFLDAPTPP